MEVSYSQKWIMPQGVEDAWNFFIHCLKDSDSVGPWPHTLSSLNSDGIEIRKGTKVHATYKLGPAKIKAEYLMDEILPERKIVYRTGKNHLLRGKSEIHFTPAAKGTLCHWHGKYASKNIQGYPALIWFKLFFEPLFFSQLKSRLGDKTKRR